MILTRYKHKERFSLLLLSFPRSDFGNGVFMTNTITRKPKYQEILETLLQEVGTGRFREGAQLPTDQDLAGRFDVSRPTITRAVQEMVRMGLVRRQAGAGTFLCKAADERRMVFGLIVPELGDSEIFEPIYGQITRDIQMHGHYLQWAGTNTRSRHREKTGNALAACKHFVKAGVAGVFMAPFVTPPGTENPNQKIVHAFQRAGISIVLLDRDIVSFPHRSEFDLVGVDHLRGQSQVTESLIKSGHRRLGFWVWENVANSVKLRSAGILQTAFDLGVPFTSNSIQTCDPDNPEQVSRLLSEHRPDAIMCANDVFAAHLLKTLNTIDVNVPQDLSVVGYDDVRYSNLLRVPLTTVSQPCEQIGEVAAHLMLERVKHPDLPAREVLLSPKLTNRDSTMPRGESN